MEIERSKVPDTFYGQSPSAAGYRFQEAVKGELGAAVPEDALDLNAFSLGTFDLTKMVTISQFDGLELVARDEITPMRVQLTLRRQPAAQPQNGHAVDGREDTPLQMTAIQRDEGWLLIPEFALSKISAHAPVKLQVEISERASQVMRHIVDLIEEGELQTIDEVATRLQFLIQGVAQEVLAHQAMIELPNQLVAFAGNAGGAPPDAVEILANGVIDEAVAVPAERIGIDFDFAAVQPAGAIADVPGRFLWRDEQTLRVKPARSPEEAVTHLEYAEKSGDFAAFDAVFTEIDGQPELQIMAAFGAWRQMTLQFVNTMFQTFGPTNPQVKELVNGYSEETQKLEIVKQENQPNGSVLLTLRREKTAPPDVSDPNQQGAGKTRESFAEYLAIKDETGWKLRPARSELRAAEAEQMSAKNVALTAATERLALLTQGIATRKLKNPLAATKAYAKLVEEVRTKVDGPKP